MKTKIKRRYQLERALQEMGTIVTTNDKEYKFLPYWFEFSGDSIFAHHLDNIPEELREYIQQKRQKYAWTKILPPK